MEDHPTAVVEKAKRLEQLLQRVEQGEPLEQVCAELDLAVDAQRQAQLEAKYQAGGRTWEALLDGRYGHPIKAHSALREWLHERKHQDKATDLMEWPIALAYQVGGEDLIKDLGGPVKLVFPAEASDTYPKEVWMWWVAEVQIE